MLAVLFWTGVALAPLAALLLLVANSGFLLRIAAVAAIGCVVLIGVSIALRGDPESVRVELEGTLLDEVDALREDVREDITTAARATHRAFGERVQTLNQSVESLRAEVQAVRAGGGVPVPGPVAPPARPAQHPEEVAPVAAGYQHGGEEWAEPAPPSGYTGPAREQQPDRYGRQPANGYEHAAAVPEGPPRAAGGIPRQRGGGRVRYAETVQVTTRETIVDDGDGERPDTGRVYGGPSVYGRPPEQPGYAGHGGNGHADHGGNGYAEHGTSGHADHGGSRHGGHGYSDHGGSGYAERGGNGYGPPPAPPRGRRAAEPGTPSWGDGRDANGDGRDAPWGEDQRRPQPGEYGRPAGEGSPWAQNTPRPGQPPAAEGPRGGVRQAEAGDRWATARADEHGSEVRMAERRAAVRADATGAELRVEDRWASVRSEEPRPGRRRRDDDTNPGMPVPAPAPAADAGGWGDDWVSALRTGPTAPELTSRSDAPTWSEHDGGPTGGRRRRDEDDRPHSGSAYQHSHERW